MSSLPSTMRNPTRKSLTASNAKPRSCSRRKVDRALVEAAESDDLEAVEAALSAGAALNACASPHGQTALTAAIGDDADRVVAYLLARPEIDLDAADEFGSTPIMEAAGARNAALVARLLDGGVDLAVRDEFGNTPLSAVALYLPQELALVERIVAQCVAQNVAFGAALHEIAGSLKHTAVLTLLLAHGADPNARDQNGDTPLHCAAAQGHTEAATQLLAAGADIDARDPDGRTPLFLAMRCPSFTPDERWDKTESLVRLLVERGSDLEARDANGCTPLAEAARRDHFNAVRFLLAKGADIETRDKHGTTPFLETATLGAVATAKILADAGANIHAVGAHCGNAATIALSQRNNSHKSVRDFGVTDSELVRRIAPTPDQTQKEILQFDVYLEFLAGLGIEP